MNTNQDPGEQREPLFRKGEEFAIISLTLGVVSLVALCVCAPLALITSPIGIVLGIKSQYTRNHRMALIGTLLNAIAFGLTFGGVIIFVILLISNHL